MQGEFKADELLMPDTRTDGPAQPAAIFASYDDYCDQVVISWLPTVRTTSYDLYKDGVLIAEDLTDTTYTDLEAVPVETEYYIYSKNVNGYSVDSASAIGRMADIPPPAPNFSATDGEYEAKVDLTWDAADFAKYYQISRAGVVLADSVVGTAYSDTEDAPQEDTEYSIIAYSLCGHSDAATAMGKADSLLKYSIILDENFDGMETGFDLATLDMFSYRFQYTATGGPGTFTVSEDAAVSGTKSGKAIYDQSDISTVDNARSIQIVFDDINLLVGQRYRISFKIKTLAKTALHVAIDSNEDGIPSKGDGLESYLIPSAVNSKNQNIFGVRLTESPEWKTVSYEFPFTGDVTQDVYDPDPVALGWTPTTIQEGQQTPKIMIAQWVGKGSFDGICPHILIDDILIELVK